MNDYPPSSIAVDVRFTIAAHDLPGIVQILEELPEGFPTIERVEFPANPIVFGASHHDEELADAFARICDNEGAG